jgi:hypothetical protein
VVENDLAFVFHINLLSSVSEVIIFFCIKYWLPVAL